MHELGNDQRFAEWVHAHGDTVRAFLFAMVRRRDVAEDLTQEVFCRAWVARDAYQEHGKILPYLLKIADRLVCDRGRRRPPDVSLDREQWKRYEPVSSAATPPEAAATAEQMAALNAALECLSPLQRRVLLLRYFGQMTFAEIAQVIGCPLNTTASHCRRGLEALRRLLGPDQ